MAQYEMKAYEDLFQDRNDDVTDLHAYYMSQFNLELETGGKNKTKVDTFKYGIEESFDFEVLDSFNNSNINTKSNATEFEIIDEVLDTNMNEQNIKDVLFDLNSIEFDECSYKNDSIKENDGASINYYETNTEYIDDESLIDELCREDSESCRLSPEGCTDEYFLPLSNETNLLPSIETAFSKRYCNYNVDENQSVPYNIEKLDQTNGPIISSVEQYSYPNNILYNLDSNNKYSLPDTPTSCNEFNFTRSGRKTSVSESIESDVHSSSYYDENSETLDEDELFVNLDDFGITFEKENEAVAENSNKVHTEKKSDKSQSVAIERTCLWEHCYEKYNSQNALVEHIERVHVNTYKGDEFSCFWQECARARRPFNARYKLLIHMRVHSGHKPNRCHHPGCGKSFSRLENLKIHVRSHTGERPYACPAPHCMKAFSNSSDRAKHQRTHFNARPYACGAAGCGKRYTDPSSLRKHVKSHPHITSVPRTCVPTRPIRKVDEQMVPSSPAKLTTLRCIRDKLTIPRLQRL